MFLSHGTALSAGVGILFSRSFNHFNAVQIRKRVVQLYTLLYENDFVSTETSHRLKHPLTAQELHLALKTMQG